MFNKENQLSQNLDPLIKFIAFYNNIDKERNQQLSICSIKTCSGERQMITTNSQVILKENYKTGS